MQHSYSSFAADLLDSLRAQQPVIWLNPHVLQHSPTQDSSTAQRLTDVLQELPLTRMDFDQAAKTWSRLASLITDLFPQTIASGGVIDSPLLPLTVWPSAAVRARLGMQGHVLLKADSELPVCGSVKARGGMYEVLTAAERFAQHAGLLLPVGQGAAMDHQHAGACTCGVPHGGSDIGSVPAQSVATPITTAEVTACGSAARTASLAGSLGQQDAQVSASRVQSAAADVPSSGSSNVLATGAGREVLQHYTVAVGSTGNLGLSVGICGAALGMHAVVHMSREAKTWKKELLRHRGVQVVEHAGDYNTAVAQGRASALADPRAHFVDDEHSHDLFLGYSTAALHLKAQLQAMDIAVSMQQPLVVYLPCGVGGAPGGICWGLAHVFGDAVHVFYAEPTAACCCLLGLASGRGADTCVAEVGCSGQTVADGLAVCRPSQLCCDMTGHLVAGVYTATDSEMLAASHVLQHAEGHYIEPSCGAALLGLARLAEAADTGGREATEGSVDRCDGFSSDTAASQAHEEAGASGVASRQRHAEYCGWLLRQGVHVLWATGGSLVPQHERDEALTAGGHALERGLAGGLHCLL